jgi:hypothetical protein
MFIGRGTWPNWMATLGTDIGIRSKEVLNDDDWMNERISLNACMSQRKLLICLQQYLSLLNDCGIMVGRQRVSAYYLGTLASTS